VLQQFQISWAKQAWLAKKSIKERDNTFG